MNVAPSLDALRAIPLFFGFTDEELAEIGGLFGHVGELGPHNLVFEADSPAVAFYLLTGGEVTLTKIDDDTYRLRPPALIGELGALTGLARNCRAVASDDAELWQVSTQSIQQFFAVNQELGVRFLVNLLNIVADKINRDQARLHDMRKNLVRTQKAMKTMRDLILDSKDTEISAPLHDTIDEIIRHNRRVNYRVNPPPTLSAAFRVDEHHEPYVITEISRTHLSFSRRGKTPATGAWITGVLSLAGPEIPVSGKVLRTVDGRIDVELDLLIDDYASVLEGFLTRVQLLDFLV
jgi:CRP/FNR family transcriptional regulator, cyclic AMP receptor protein